MIIGPYHKNCSPLAKLTKDFNTLYIPFHELGDGLFDLVRGSGLYPLEVILNPLEKHGIVEVVQFSIETSTSPQAIIESLLLWKG